MAEFQTSEFYAFLTPDKRAQLCLDGRELLVSARDDIAAGLSTDMCPVELLGAALAA